MVLLLLILMSLQQCSVACTSCLDFQAADLAKGILAYPEYFERLRGKAEAAQEIRKVKTRAH